MHDMEQAFMTGDSQQLAQLMGQGVTDHQLWTYAAGLNEGVAPDCLLWLIDRHITLGDDVSDDPYAGAHLRLKVFDHYLAQWLLECDMTERGSGMVYRRWLDDAAIPQQDQLRDAMARMLVLMQTQQERTSRRYLCYARNDIPELAHWLMTHAGPATLTNLENDAWDFLNMEPEQREFLMQHPVMVKRRLQEELGANAGRSNSKSKM